MVAGKRTFSSFVSKVKAKISEMDHNRFVSAHLIPCISTDDMFAGTTTKVHPRVATRITHTSATVHRIRAPLIDMQQARRSLRNTTVATQKPLPRLILLQPAGQVPRTKCGVTMWLITLQSGRRVSV